jgi:hypothetical protein
MKDSLQKISPETRAILIKEKVRQEKKEGRSDTFKKMIGDAVADKYGQ